jgi:hypothetical protein
VGIVSYVWQEESDILSYDSQVMLDDLATGRHTISLKVEDDEGLSDSDEVVITVNEN